MRLGLKRRRAELRVETASDMMLNSYPGPLGQVLMNLIGNAYTHGFPNDEPGLVTVSTARQGDRAVVTVSDDGRGIPSAIAADRPHLS